MKNFFTWLVGATTQQPKSKIQPPSSSAAWSLVFGVCRSSRRLWPIPLRYLGVLLALLPLASHAQWQQQTFQLRPGWNAVFLEVHPEPEDCDTLFAGLPVESAWEFNRVVNLPQFVQDPTTLTPGAPGWLTWFPGNHPLAGQGSLFILRDGRPYLIKVATNAPTFTWTVTGRPSLRRMSWYAGGMNFAGFHLAATGPTFQTLFSGESGLSGQPVYSLDAAGVWRRFLDLSTARPRAGEGYWIRCSSPAQRAGTIVVETGSREGLRFLSGAWEQSLRIRNTSAAARNLTVRLLASAPPPPGQPARIGPVPVEYRRSDFPNASFDWMPLPAALTFTALPPGQEWNVRLGARLPVAPVAAGALYQSLLEVTDDAGTRWLVPVTAIPPGSSSSSSSSSSSTAAEFAPAGQAPSPSAYAGLWVGDAVLKAVSQPAHLGSPTTARPAGGEFPFRLMVHVDAGGVARLLRQAYVVRKPATLVPDPENPGFERVDQPARTLVITEESLIPGLIGPGEVTGRRISSVAFGFSNPIPLSGGAFAGGTLSASVSLDYNHPLNPFKHRFHPDHNNLDERFEQTLGEGRESFTVTRTLSMEFTASDPLGQNPPGWGDTELGGIYRETLAGLHRSPIQVSGTFRLVRATRSPALNQ